MSDFNVVIKQADGTEIITNTDMIWGDVIRMRIGLQPKDQE